jgi:uncharacterized protein YdhG (YjbR/CyaY superfamily)
MENRNQEVTDYILQYEGEKAERLERIRGILHEEVPEIKEKLWTKVPCFYIDKKTIVIRVFKDHINLFAEGTTQYKDELADYSITPKGALQIFDQQDLPEKVLGKIVRDSFL